MSVTEFPKILSDAGLTKLKLWKLAKAEGSKLSMEELTKLAVTQYGSALHELISEELTKETKKKRKGKAK